MKNVKIILCLLLLAFVLPQTVSAQKVAQSGFKFLDVNVGGRASGMGDAYTILGNGADAVFYNPAGLTQMQNKFDLNFSYFNFIADISYISGAAAWDLGTIGTVAAQFMAPSYPEMQGTEIVDTDEGFIDTGLFSPKALVVGVSYAKSLTDKFHIGATVKYASQELGSSRFAREGDDSEWSANRANTVAVDFGTLFYPKFGWLPSFAFGMSVRNFSQAVKYEITEFELPVRYTLGFKVDVFDLLGEIRDNMCMNLAVDAIHPRDHHERVHVGAEFTYADLFSVRGGYKFKYDEEGLTFGFGVKKGPVRIDYAYTNFGVFDNVSRFSMGLCF
ncbi:PorV/PorQ family protein [bacterium]|nr:PorV/PorQ family protein [bacterium]